MPLQMIPIKVETEEGKIVSIMARLGQNLLKEMRRNDVKIAAACEGNLGCGTCHVYLDPQAAQKLSSSISEKEDDLLNFVPGLKPESRLACGLNVSKELENTLIRIPKINRNLVQEEE